MGYPKKLLNEYETVALDLHPHWWYFAEPVTTLLAAVAFGIASLVVDVNDDLQTVWRWAALVLVVVTAFWLAGRYAKWTTTNFVITSDRLIYRSGVLAKRGIEIPVERVNNVIFNQSVFERILGAGDLMIESAGAEGQQRFTDIKHPERVQKLLHAQMESNGRRNFEGLTSGNDVASQLEKLEGMLERGTLSQDEFDRQKAKLLDT
ncbi:MAG TPA: PH domain-containing protein [Ilumatobacter sp.]|nr:PH domain-containing protein [Ilumatobacter sp.]